MQRRHFLGTAAAAPFTTALARAAEARKQIKITGLETDLLRLPPSPTSGERPGSPAPAPSAPAGEPAPPAEGGSQIN